MTKSELERRATEMKNRLTGGARTIEAGPRGERKLSLAEAARELGVSYSTARRLLAHEPDVMRYSTTTAGTATVFPNTPLKRHQRVRMSYVVPESVIVRVQHQMCGASGS
jgi:hypothetical protein